MVNDNMFSLSVFRRQLDSFLEHRCEVSFSTSFAISSTSSLLIEGFYHAAWAICLYVPRASIFPRDSKPSGSFLSVSFDGHFTLIETSIFLGTVCVGLSIASALWTLFSICTGETGQVLGNTLDFETGVDVQIFGTVGSSSPSSSVIFRSLLGEEYTSHSLAPSVADLFKSGSTLWPVWTFSKKLTTSAYCVIRFLRFLRLFKHSLHMKRLVDFISNGRLFSSWKTSNFPLPWTRYLSSLLIISRKHKTQLLAEGISIAMTKVFPLRDIFRTQSWPSREFWQ